jgi:2-iminobutanoate/2-iminopropanoate deaminase
VNILEGKMKQAVILDYAAKPAGPYSHAVIANGLIFVSGQGPANPKTGKVSEIFEDQVHQVFANMKTILEGCGASLDDVVKVNAFLSDLTYFQRFNLVYSSIFYENYPARTTIAAGLNEILVEIDCIAVQRD